MMPIYRLKVTNLNSEITSIKIKENQVYDEKGNFKLQSISKEIITKTKMKNPQFIIPNFTRDLNKRVDPPPIILVN